MGQGAIFNLRQITEEVTILQVLIQVRRPPDPLAGKPYRLPTIFDLSSLTDTVTKGGLGGPSICLEELEQSFMPNMAEKKQQLLMPLLP